jgi:hypothetical protein
MRKREAIAALTPDRADYGVAAIIGLLALAAYVRTLAPDLLYGDSAEFQTLAYTLGTTHSTGYPVYLLLARLVGFVPLYTLAGRVNLVSALGGAATVGGLYLLARFLTPSRVGAALGSLALASTYTLWSQAILAEVYTPATAFLVAIMLLLAYWQRQPRTRRRALAWATGIACLGLGVHASVALIGPTALLFVLWVVASQPREQWWPTLSYAVLGFGIGIGLYFLAFIALDLNNPPSSFIQVMLYPSRSLWGLQSSDLDNVFQRWWLTASGVQWQDVMFPEDASLSGTLAFYVSRLLGAEFSLWMLVLAMFGLGALSPAAGNEPDSAAEMPVSLPRLVLTAPSGARLGAFMLVTYVVMLVFVLNYHPGDRHLFYLPTYLFVALALGRGIGRVLEWTHNLSAKRGGWTRGLYPLAVVVCVVVVVSPHAGSRWEALQSGVGTFVDDADTYPYPRDNLEEPRQVGLLRLYTLPEDAFVVMNWRELYTLYYLAHVEGLRPNIIIKEATPYGSGGEIADTLLDEMLAALDAGRPVLADQVYPRLRDQFRVMPVAGGRFYQLTLLESQGTE